MALENNRYNWNDRADWDWAGEQFAYGIESLVGKDHNRLTSGIGITPALTHNVDQVYFNRDRLNPVYVESHLIRLREAYQKYVVAAK